MLSTSGFAWWTGRHDRQPVRNRVAGCWRKNHLPSQYVRQVRQHAPGAVVLDRKRTEEIGRSLIGEREFSMTVVKRLEVLDGRTRDGDEFPVLEHAVVRSKRWRRGLAGRQIFEQAISHAD